jgi:hypothetical protein
VLRGSEEFIKLAALLLIAKETIRGVIVYLSKCWRMASLLRLIDSRPRLVVITWTRIVVWHHSHFAYTVPFNRSLASRRDLMGKCAGDAYAHLLPSLDATPPGRVCIVGCHTIGWPWFEFCVH